MIYKEIVLKKDEHIFDGINLTQLAKAMKVNRTYLSQIKNERTSCNAKFRNRVLATKSQYKLGVDKKPDRV